MLSNVFFDLLLFSFFNDSLSVFPFICNMVCMQGKKYPEMIISGYLKTAITYFYLRTALW